MEAGKARRGRRPLQEGPALDRERLLRILSKLAEAEGIAALNMRRVAAEAGVSHRLLYHHVRNKDEMFDLLGDAILGRNMPDLSSPDWEMRLRAVVAASRKAFRGFPGLPANILSHSIRRSAQPHAKIIQAAVRSALEDAGLTPAQVQEAYVVFCVLAMGSLVLIENIDAPTADLIVSPAAVEPALDNGIEMLLFAIRHMVARAAAGSDASAD